MRVRFEANWYSNRTKKFQRHLVAFFLFFFCTLIKSHERHTATPAMSKKSPDTSRAVKHSTTSAPAAPATAASSSTPSAAVSGSTASAGNAAPPNTSASASSTRSSSNSPCSATAPHLSGSHGNGAPFIAPPPSGLIPRLHATPRSDIPVKRTVDTRCSSSSSRFAGLHPPVFVALPPLLGTEQHSFFFFLRVFFFSVFACARLPCLFCRFFNLLTSVCVFFLFSSRLLVDRFADVATPCAVSSQVGAVPNCV